MQEALEAEHVTVKVVAPRSGMIRTAEGDELEADQNFTTAASVLFDAVFVPGGAASVTQLKKVGDAIHCVREAYKHCKPIAAVGEALDMVSDLPGVTLATDDGSVVSDKGVVTALGVSVSAGQKIQHAVGLAGGPNAGELAKAFLEALARHRFWERAKESVPA